MSENTVTSQEFVTTIISHRVRSGREAGYEEWLKGISAVVQTFEGYLGTSIFRPKPDGSPDHILVVQFDTGKHLLAWLGSEARQEWLDRAAPLLEEPDKVQKFTGFEAWFECPPHIKVPPAPERYRQAILVWTGVMAVSAFRQPLLDPLLKKLPLILEVGSGAAVTVACLTYVVMPALRQTFKHWLYPSVHQ